MDGIDKQTDGQVIRHCQPSQAKDLIRYCEDDPGS